MDARKVVFPSPRSLTERTGEIRRRLAAVEENLAVHRAILDERERELRARAHGGAPGGKAGGKRKGGK